MPCFVTTRSTRLPLSPSGGVGDGDRNPPPLRSYRAQLTNPYSFFRRRSFLIWILPSTDFVTTTLNTTIISWHLSQWFGRHHIKVEEALAYFVSEIRSQELAQIYMCFLLLPQQSLFCVQRTGETDSWGRSFPLSGWRHSGNLPGESRLLKLSLRSFHFHFTYRRISMCCTFLGNCLKFWNLYRNLLNISPYKRKLYNTTTRFYIWEAA